MKHEAKKPCGSFIAHGVGLSYQFEAPSKTLTLFSASTDGGYETPYLTTQIDKAFTIDNPSIYIALLEKATQVQALIYSNSKSIDLQSILIPFKLRPILKNTVRLARYSYALHRNATDSFTEVFQQDLGIEKIKFEHVPQSPSGHNAFYTAIVQTSQGNIAAARGDVPEQALLRLASSIRHDLLPQEYTNLHSNHSCAQKLLRLASELQIIATVIDPKSTPEHSATNINSHNASSTS